MTHPTPERLSTTARIGLGLLLGLSLLAVVATPLAAADTSVTVAGCGPVPYEHRTIEGTPGAQAIVVWCI